MGSSRLKIVGFTVVMIMAFLMGTQNASAQILNEVVANPVVGDGGCEYVEIRGVPNQALTNVYFAAVEGDINGNTGRFDLVVDLTAARLGSNGLLVIIAETNTGDCITRNWGAPATSLVLSMEFDSGALENGTNSFLLFQSNEPLIENTDYDTNDDGTLESLPAGTLLIDSVAWADGNAGDINYGDVILPPTDGGTNDMATRFSDNDLPNEQGAWYHGDMDGTTSDSLDYDPSQVSDNFPEGGILTPGRPNAPGPNPDPYLNEVVVNPVVGDGGCEYIEIRGMPNQALTNVYFAAVEGDVNGNTGRFDLVVDLTAASFGRNGLLVIIAETNTGDCMARKWGAPATSQVLNMEFDSGALENGSNSFLLFQSNEPLIENTDYDTNDDGTLESLPAGTLLIDSVAWTDGNAGDINYGDVILPPTDGGTNDMATRFPDNDLPNEPDAWYHGDMDGDSSDVLFYDPSQVSDNFPDDGRLTPGGPNAPNGDIFADGFE